MIGTITDGAEVSGLARPLVSPAAERENGILDSRKGNATALGRDVAPRLKCSPERARAAANA